jgi:branched-subunit amino acid aminotransferase/4-amino-4-deoxychorismate lyase
MSSYIQANTNGRLHDAREPALSPLNRGFLYGDAIYEVWRTYQGVLFAWEEHWRRLQQSGTALHIVMPGDAAAMLNEIKRTAAAFRAAAPDTGELYVRLQITRGAGAIGLDTALAEGPDYTLLVQTNKDLTPAILAKGYTLSLETTLRRNPANTINPAWKTGNYLNNILCLRAARERGADDVVMVNQLGEITEAATSNLAFIRAGVILTPPMDAGILGGITRELVLREVAAKAGFAVREVALTPADIGSMEECFIMSTTRDISPVGAIDQQRFRVAADSQTMRLKAAFADHVARYVAAHPGQRLA